MSDNDIIILDKIVKGKKQQIEASLNDSDFFEIFAFEQVLKNYELSYDELIKGNIDGGDDGGIDGLFVFLNGELLDDDTNLEHLRKNPLFEIFLIQAKSSNSFSELAVGRVISTTRNVLDLTKDTEKLKTLYNSKLIEKATTFRDAYMESTSLHPDVKLYYIYASKGDTANIHPKVKEFADELRKTVSQFFPSAQTETKFMGARELIDSSRLEKSYTLQLRFLENYLSRGDNNYIVLSSLIDYYKFVTDENGNLRRYIFESNVRDYQGNVEVNRDIQNSLACNDGMDFWWLNNGITILASKASIAGKVITLDDVQIVNGLQSTTVIHNYFKSKDPKDKNDLSRSILIRIIVTIEPEARDRIIKATNFQTAIPPASLKAMDRIQRDIEDYFLQEGWFYDRRKNFYKNMGKPINKIIGIPLLAQAVMAIILKEPDNARARPSTLIKREEDYSRVFDNKISPRVYLFCAKAMKKIDALIRGDLPKHKPQDRNNLKFHIAMILTTKLTGKTEYQVQDVASLSVEDITDELITGSLNETMSLAYKFSKKQQWTIERLAKNNDFVEYLLKNVAPQKAN